MPATPNRPEPPPLLTVRDVERRLGVSNSTARKLLASGELRSITLPGLRARRVRPEDQAPVRGGPVAPLAVPSLRHPDDHSVNQSAAHEDEGCAPSAG